MKHDDEISSALDNGLYHYLWKNVITKTPSKQALLRINNVHDSLSFAELDYAVKQLAEQIHLLVVNSPLTKHSQDNVVVGVYATSSDELILAYLAIIHNGYVFCPISSTTDVDQASRLFHTVNAHLVMHCGQEHDLVLNGVATFNVTSWLKILEHALPNNDSSRFTNTEPPKVNCAEAAHIIFTSATSTGCPKAVLCDQTASMYSHLNRFNTTPFKPNDVTGCNLFGIWDAMCALMNGTAIVMIPDEVMTDGLKLVQFVNRFNVSRIMLTPSLATRLVQLSTDITNQLRSSLWLVTFCGEVAHQSILESTLGTLGPNSTVVNLYSISECADVATQVIRYEDCFGPSQNFQFGVLTPLAGVGITITAGDVSALANVQHVKEQQIGQLLVSGVGLGLAYVGNIEATRASFPSVFIQTDDDCTTRATIPSGVTGNDTKPTELPTADDGTAPDDGTTAADDDTAPDGTTAADDGTAPDDGTTAADDATAPDGTTAADDDTAPDGTTAADDGTAPDDATTAADDATTLTELTAHTYKTTNDRHSSSHDANNVAAKCQSTRVFVTNDLCRFVGNGENQFVVLGRNSECSEVKIRGFRIVLSNIENAIRQVTKFPLLDCAAFVANQGSSLAVALVPNRWPLANDWRTVLLKGLANVLPMSHMPQHLICYENSLPTKPGTGKRDVKAILRDIQEQYHGTKFKPGSLEQALASGQLQNIVEAVTQLMASVIGLPVESVSPTDSLYDLGGHSLLMMDLVHQLSSECNIDVGVNQVAQAPTSVGIAQLLLSNDQGVLETTKELAKEMVHDYQKSRQVIGTKLANVLASKTQATSKQRRILVTGATGWVGSFLVKTLVEYSTLHNLVLDLHVLCRKQTTLTEYMLAVQLHGVELNISENANVKVTVVQGDVAVPGLGLQSDSFNVDVVFNCAGNVDIHAGYATMRKVNVEGTINLIQWITNSSIRQGFIPVLVHVSSSAALAPYPPENSKVKLSDKELALVKRWCPSKYEEWIETSTWHDMQVKDVCNAMAHATSLFQGTYQGYSTSKCVAEQIVTHSNLPSVIVRPSSISVPVQQFGGPVSSGRHSSLKLVTALAVSLVKLQGLPKLPVYARVCWIPLDELCNRCVAAGLQHVGVPGTSVKNAIRPTLNLQHTLARIEQQWTARMCQNFKKNEEDRMQDSDFTSPISKVVERIEFTCWCTKLRSVLSHELEWQTLFATPYGIEGILGMCEYPLQEPNDGFVSCKESESDFIEMVLKNAELLL